MIVDSQWSKDFLRTSLVNISKTLQSTTGGTYLIDRRKQHPLKLVATGFQKNYILSILKHNF